MEPGLLAVELMAKSCRKSAPPRRNALVTRSLARQSTARRQVRAVAHNPRESISTAGGRKVKRSRYQVVCAYSPGTSARVPREHS
jgi:hypothetical protein